MAKFKGQVSGSTPVKTTPIEPESLAQLEKIQNYLDTPGRPIVLSIEQEE